jgi:quinol monooxygenase YgiN
MPTITKNNNVVTVVDMYPIDVTHQQELIDLLVEEIRTMLKQQAGFVSASLHKSRDGVRIGNYMQWRSQNDHSSAKANLAGQEFVNALHRLSQPDSHLYEVAIIKPENHTTVISKGSFVVFGEFRLKPENQPRLLEQESQKVEEALKQFGLLSANFHRGLDGTRMINYAQMRSQADLEALAHQPDFAPATAYWKDLAENEYHGYEVVLIEEAS